MEDACRLIREDCASVTVQQLADTLNLNRSYLSRIFKESTGLSLQAYISNARLRTARDLLMENHTVAQAAAMVGYSDEMCIRDRLVIALLYRPAPRL